jgi:division protein CdvB (Snf7/Vps24/ESCRT-III family)
MKGLKTSLGRFMPEADSELNSMTQTLNGLMVDSLSGDSFNMESDISSEETDKILQEASAIAEQQIGDKFPSVPSLDGLPLSNKTTSSTSSTFE